MVSYRYLGYGTTDSNGIAKLDHDENGNEITHSYTGAGAGKMQVVASLDRTITNNSTISETYVLWDTLFYDTGADESQNNQWNVNQSTGTKELTENGLRLSNPTDPTRYDLFIRQTGKTTNYYWNAPYCIEMDITELVGTSRLQIYSSQTSETLNIISSTGHWKIEYDGTTVTVYKNETAAATYTRNLPNARIGFYVQTGGSITYKNFMIYLI